MRDIFALITERVLRDFGEGPICAHVGDIHTCAIKNHPTYGILRDRVRLGRSKSVASLRTWESVESLAREGDKPEREKWLIMLLDLLTPYFRGWSKELARRWNYEVSDIRSAMVEGALEAWFSHADSTPSRKLLDTMMTRAFARARSLVDAGSSETCAEDVSQFAIDATKEEESTLRASSIIDATIIRDPDADERIRGERTGALLKRMGAMEHTTILHGRIRGGSRNGKEAPAITPKQMSRSWVDGMNLYYRFSELLPEHISFSDAANSIGISESQASRMARKGTLPFRVFWVGNTRVVSVKSLMAVLGIQDSIVHPDDVENGAAHCGGQ
ncbi:hypothetical protein ACGFW5_11090 [Streptomyces sp. NPDC048416]|uniref:hypothetical protein n=1 Tax=Streptomyces sp. NPDC048416 TaxID=3365546 RepID=UPI0037116DF5